MPYSLTFKDNVNWMYVRVEGVLDSLEEMLTLSREVLARCHGDGKTRLLVDERDCVRKLDNHDLACLVDALLDDMVQTMGFRVVLLYAPEREDFYKSWETLCANRSLSMKVVTSTGEGIDWLLK